MNQDDRVLLNPPELDETGPSGENRSWQRDSVGKRDRIDEGGNASLVDDNCVNEFLVGVPEDPLSISSSDEGSQRSLGLEVGETESLNSNLNFSGTSR